MCSLEIECVLYRSNAFYIYIYIGPGHRVFFYYFVSNWAMVKTLKLFSKEFFFFLKGSRPLWCHHISFVLRVLSAAPCEPKDVVCLLRGEQEEQEEEQEEQEAGLIQNNRSERAARRARLRAPPTPALMSLLHTLGKQ
jgi:hypothetical protein